MTEAMEGMEGRNASGGDLWLHAPLFEDQVEKALSEKVSAIIEEYRSAGAKSQGDRPKAEQV